MALMERGVWGKGGEKKRGRKKRGENRHRGRTCPCLRLIIDLFAKGGGKKKKKKERKRNPYFVILGFDLFKEVTRRERRGGEKSSHDPLPNSW